MTNLVIEIQAADGTAKAKLFYPDVSATKASADSQKAGPGQPGVVLYMDAFGLRPALDQMAKRLASEGYIVLVPDLFYRSGPYGLFDAKTAFGDEHIRNQLIGLIGATTQEMTMRDTGTFLDVLEREGVTGAIGVVGYCMGGARALTAAASYSDRIAAAASFHGGNLACEAPDSPHLLAARIKGRIYVGVAGVDPSFPPEQSARLAVALRSAEVDHVIENYVGMDHGWTVPDHAIYDQTGAERHWRRLTTFFSETLKQ